MIPDNGVILVFTDTGSVGLELWNSIDAKARRKNVKIFFALLLGKDAVHPNSMNIYSHLSENRIFPASSSDGHGQLNIDTRAFFDAVTRQVMK